MPPPPPRPGRSATRPVVPAAGATELSLDTYHASSLSIPFYDNRLGGAGTAWSTGSPWRGRSHE